MMNRTRNTVILSFFLTATGCDDGSSDPAGYRMLEPVADTETPTAETDSEGATETSDPTDTEDDTTAPPEPTCSGDIENTCVFACTRYEDSFGYYDCEVVIDTCGDGLQCGTYGIDSLQYEGTFAGGHRVYVADGCEASG